MHFLARFAAEEGRRVTGIAKETLELLTGYSWPGNVRQLENAMFRAVVLADGPQLTVAEFPQIAAHVEGFRAAIPAGSGPGRQAAGDHRARHAGRGGHGAADGRDCASVRQRQGLARHPRGHRRPARSARSRPWRPT